MVTISKSEMLARIVESSDKPFRLQFVKANGKKAGEVSEKVCYYGAPNPNPIEKKPGAATKRAPRKSHLESNTIPLTEFGTGKMQTPFISHIITFNGKQVIH